MILRIDASSDDYLEMFLVGKGEKFRKKRKTNFNQAEVFFVLLSSLLDLSKKELQDIEKIEINSRGKGFSSLRIAISSANALAFWLGVKIETSDNGEVIEAKNFSFTKPQYEAEPNIG